MGNVLVRWAPLEVMSTIFPEFNAEHLSLKMRPIWIDLNAGKLTEQDAVEDYQKNLGLAREKLVQLMFELKRHQTPIEGSIALLEELKQLKINLFSITDNVKEIIDYHEKNSEFPKYFRDIITSFEVGVLKPDQRIYKTLLEKHNLNPVESIFIDDVVKNVEGAISVGIQAFQFTDMGSCRDKIMTLMKQTDN